MAFPSGMEWPSTPTGFSLRSFPAVGTHANSERDEVLILPFHPRPHSRCFAMSFWGSSY